MIIDHIDVTEFPMLAAMAYFYFDYRQQDIQSPGAFVASIVRQLVSRAASLPRSLLSTYERFRHEEARNLMLELRDILNDAVNLFDCCYIVIDALDECVAQTSRKIVTEILSSMKPEKIQLFITSRPHLHEMKQSFKNALHIEITAREEDLKMYCHRMIDCNENTKDLVNEALRNQIVDTLASKAQGMYVMLFCLGIT